MINTITSYSDAEQLADFQNGVLAWADYIDLIKEGCIDKQIGKIKEEVNEYQEAIEAGDFEHAGEELADIFVTCIVSAEQNNIKLIDYLHPVIKKLISRQDTGRIIGGSFIKFEDLPNE